MHQINDDQLSSFIVGFDLDENAEKVYRLKPFIEKLTDVIHEFAFGFHEGTETLNTELVSKVAEAAKSIYKIDGFQKVKDIYDNDGTLSDDVTEKYLRRGEFGELILHLLLRDFYKTTPLLSKIYFKDSLGHTVHGFDAVHIQEDTKTLWLGESKLYHSGKSGVKALVEDIAEHFKSDYLNSEFMLISKKIKHFNNIPEKDYWNNLMSKSSTLSDQLASINIPLLCTYECELFSKYSDEKCEEFIQEYTLEINALKDYFDSINVHPLKSHLNVILILFPVQNKKALVKGLHHRLSLLQALS